MNQRLRSENGRITIEWTSGIVRMVDQNAEGSMPAYFAVGVIVPITENSVKMCGFCGSMPFRHMLEMVELLIDMGYRWAYVERANGRMPCSELIITGPFAGWRLMDLEQAKKFLHRRYPPQKS